MKQFFSTASAVLLAFCISCNQPATSTDNKNTDSTTQKNLDAAHTINKAIETGDVSTVDNVMAEDAVDHSGEKGDIKGRDSIKAMLAQLHTMDSNMKMEMLKELADNDYVFEWMRFTGTSNGSMGMPAGPYDFSAIEVTKFSNGKATEHWEFMQPADMMKMMNNTKQNMPDKKDKMHK